MMQPGERMTACGLILPDGIKDPGEMAEQGRIEELAGRLLAPKPLYECLTDTLAEHADFSLISDQAAFLRRAEQGIVDLLPDGMGERAAIYVDDTLERKAMEAGAEDRLHVLLPNTVMDATVADPGIE